jgi:drug/metabolite transporter (DMT)-like permease
MRQAIRFKSKDLGIFALLIVTFLIWSNSFIAIKVLLGRMGAIDLVKLRFIPVGLISLMLILVFYRREARGILQDHPWRVVLCGLLTVPTYNLLLNAGMHYVQPSAASLMIALNPLITLLFAVRFIGETLTRRRLLGTLITFVGLGVVVLLGQVGGNGSALIPLDKLPYALLVLGAPLSWAGATVIMKPVLKNHSPLAFNFLSLSIGSLPLLIFIDQPFLTLVTSLNRLEILSAAFLSLACTLVAFGLWNIAVRHWQASNVSLFVYLNPPLTALFSYFFFGTGITFLFFIGGSIMLSGILLATLPGRKKVTLPINPID